jgi:hypothetical protein
VQKEGNLPRILDRIHNNIDKRQIEIQGIGLTPILGEGKYACFLLKRIRISRRGESSDLSLHI